MMKCGRTGTTYNFFTQYNLRIVGQYTHKNNAYIACLELNFQSIILDLFSPESFELSG